MAERVAGKVALVTGAARGQGRSHALELAREGAQIVAVDICEQLPTVAYAMATPQDLEETVSLIEAIGGACVPVTADVRDADQMQRAVDTAIAQFGRLDIVAANAGIAHMLGWEDTTSEIVEYELAVNVRGVWNTVRPAIPKMIEQGGGAIVMTASAGGLASLYGMTAYTAAKHAVVGLMRALAAELGQHWIRVNAVCPGFVLSPMTNNEFAWSVMTGGQEGAGPDDASFASETLGLLPVPWIKPEDVSKSVVFLVSDDAKYLTGVALPVDCGQVNQPGGVPILATRRIAELEEALRAADPARAATLASD